ncbi:glycosyltransferase family 2 protein [Ruegeria sp. A3M17]|uniref:glycosyltransferase family 2 protein n=1 Tax=Ruegeria sp. A3M17 TaxID=2267229 RepID=UPI000DE94B16|nr:glycosyltransferase [Ruegeria sp. A3M17]RBW54927.1 hypothetical protein DS906_15490 [Ruegeria sp. A3M17]
MSADARSQAGPHIAICIATYKRPQGLRALIDSLNNQQLGVRDVRVTLVIADNAPATTARSVLGEIQDLSCWPVIYVLEHERGIVSARNRTLAEAPPDADYFAFLDDDETASEHWLAQMLDTITLPNTVAVQGAVEPRFNVVPPVWIEQLNLFRMGPYEQGAELPAAATNNSMADAAAIRSRAMRFDPRFNTTGGEDEEFFSRLRLDSGGTIRAAAEALVWDQVPAHRATMKWLRRRWFRMGNTLGHIALIRRHGVVKRALKGVGAIGWGSVMCIFLGFGSKARWRQGALELYRGAGMLAAFLRIRFNEYNTSAVSVDRAGGG